MQSISKEIKFKKRESFIIKPVGDIHYGSKNCNTKKLEKLVDWIKNTPNVYWIGMGDMAEYINISDPRFDPKNIDKNLLGNLDNLALYQADYLAELFRPISSRCIGLLDGNHEETMRLKSHIDVNACISDKAKLPRLGYNAFINLRFIGNGHGGRRAVTIFATHGVGGAGQVGGKINRLLNLSKDFDADVYLFAHVHEKMVYSKEQLGVSQTGLNTIKKKRKT